MDDLTYELKQLCRRNKDGGAMTQAQRMGSLATIARQLKQAGFRNMHATSLKGKARRCAAGTLECGKPVGRHDQEPHVASALVGAEGRQDRHHPRR